MRFFLSIVAACTAAGVVKAGPKYRGCTSQETCAQCLNQPGCAFCSPTGKGDVGLCVKAESCAGPLKVTDRNVCVPIKCTDCGGSDNVFRVTFGQDDMEVKCVNEVDPPCVDTHHAVGAVRCFGAEHCASLWVIDHRLLTEGKYSYPDNSCWDKDCEECQAASGTCEFFTEVVSDKETNRCVPKGFLKSSKTLTKVDKCPKNLGCGDCKKGLTYRVNYGTSGVQTSCVEQCTPAQTPVGATFCYDKTMCDQISDPTYKDSGFYAYSEDSCFTKDCDACKGAVDSAGKNTCSFLTTGGSAAERGCVPRGFFSGDDLHEVDKCNSDSGDSDGKTANMVIGAFVVSLN